MTDLVNPLVAQARKTSFTQAVRLVERAVRGRKRGRPAVLEVGGDTRHDEEPLRFTSSQRMSAVANDLAGAALDPAGTVYLDVNFLGMAGATPALPSYYSEMQLQRRRLRDNSLADFLNVFNHRAISFFYRIARKYNWAIAYEREPVRGSDPVTRTLLALAGLADQGVLRRLLIRDEVMAPLAGHLGNMRRSAASVAVTLTRASGYQVTIREADPNWLAVPPSEQTVIGGPLSGRYARLGSPGGEADAAMVGASVLDVQHHFAVEIGPLPYADFLSFFQADGPRRRLAELCALTVGLSYRARARLLIDPAELPPLQLGKPDAPAMLGMTTWMCPKTEGDAPLRDCSLPLQAGGLR